MNALARVADARAVRIEDEIARRGIKLRGGVHRCGPCPRCGGTDRFSINTKKQVFNCRGFEGGDVIALVQHIDGVGFLDAIAYLAGAEPSSIVSNILKQPNRTFKQREDKSPSDARPRGLALWRASIDPRGTLVEQYLKSRALDLPAEAANEAIRFHPDCPFMAERFPTMVCLVRGIVSNEPQAIHRTALAANGRAVKRNGKTIRMSLGPTSGGAIKLDPDDDVAQGLCIGEGVETCLSGRQIGYRPVWAVGLAGITKFPVLPGSDGLTIFGEHDERAQSEKAIRSCADRWLEAGIEVLTAWPLAGNDLNDEIKVAP
jgi:hypothetical protein